MTEIPENIIEYVKEMKYQNYHNHTSYSNTSTPDSGAVKSDYAKRAKELGHSILSSCEHGFQGNYWETYRLAEENDLKFIFGAEAYWVKDRLEKDRSNNHICIFAQNENGRQAINDILSEANISGYYYKPRVDLELLLSLPANDVFVTSACVGCWNYGYEETDRIIKQLNNHFGENFMLEVQYHNVDIQKDLNKHILKLSRELNIPIIMGCDSHYVYPEQDYDRSFILEYKHIKYEEEEGFYLDYPDTITAYNRFKTQGILSDLEILNAINNTNVFLLFNDILLNRDIKLPPLFPELSQKQRNAKYKKIIVDEAAKYFKRYNIKGKERTKYLVEIAKEIQTVIDTGMADYFLINYFMVKEAKENGAIVTKSGRGCFTGDALVHTKNELKPISEVKIGDYVITKDGNFNKVLNTMSYDIDEDLVKITHEGGTDKYHPTICTKDHKILCHKNGQDVWVEAKCLERGDKVCIPKMNVSETPNIIIDLNDYNIFGYEYDDEFIYEKRKNVGGEYPYSPSAVAREIGVGKSTVEDFAKRNLNKKVFANKPDKLAKLMEYIPFDTREDYCDYIENMRTYKIKRFIELDRNINSLIGLMYGDGYTSHVRKDFNCPSCIGLAINSKTDKNIFNRDIFVGFAKTIGLDVYENKSKSKNLTQLSINSSIIGNCFKTEFFESQKGRDKTFNEKLFNQNKKCLKGLLAGLVKSDGSYSEGRINFDNTSISLINAYKILNMMVGTNPQGITFRPARIDNRGFNCKTSYKCRDINRFSESEEFRYLKIKGVENIPKTKTTVYDLTVENEHNYLINNMIVHNSAVSYFTNTLLGFSNIDRLIAPVHLFPERFMSTTRILKTKSLPDIDLNTGTPEIMVEAQRKLLGEGHSYPMIAFGTLKEKSAWKMYAGANEDKIDFETANEISKSLAKFEKDILHADDDEKDTIDVYDYIDPQYHQLFDESKKYRGIIMDKKKHPCGHLIYAGDIRREVGLIKCKSESTKKEYIVALLDGASADYFKFLKNDLLKVDVCLLHKMTADRIGIEEPTVRELITKCNSEEGKDVWNIYKKGYTLGVNQCEKPSTTKKVMKYKPVNDAELACFIAAIRPSFKSMYSTFEKREPFNYGIKVFDDIVQTETIKDSFLFFQEQIMAALAFSGIPMDECYDLIKAISKKKTKFILSYKEQFFKGFKAEILKSEEIDDELAQSQTERVWTIIENAARYGFNASHAYCMACDSLRDAHDKHFYPYEFYEVRLNYFSEKGKKDKVSGFKQEMKKAFNIKEGEYRFGLDNRKFTADKENKRINPSLLSIKGIGQKDAEQLYKLGKTKYNNFIDLYADIKEKTSVNSGKITTLIKIGYFRDFGKTAKLLKVMNIYNELYTRKEFKKNNLKEIGLTYDIVKKYSTKETEKVLKGVDVKSMIKELVSNIEDKDIFIKERLSTEIEVLGFPLTKVKTNSLYYVMKITTYKNPKSITRYLEAYNIKDGTTDKLKIADAVKFSENNIDIGDIIRVNNSHKEPKKNNVNGKWITDKKEKNCVVDDWTVY